MAISVIDSTGLQNPLASQSLSSPTITGAVVSSMASSVITSGTAQNSTSGTSITFTGIPSWVKRITVMFNGVSTSGTANYLFQTGSGSITSSGYASCSGVIYGTTPVTSTSTSGFVLDSTLAANVFSGSLILTTLGSNIWVANGVFSNIVGTAQALTVAGTVTLSGVLDRVNITTVNGTDTFDAGSINILYE